MTLTRIGEVRPSQLLYTYGPGSIIDLPHLSVLVSGIDGWASNPLAAPEVTERRLLEAVRRALGPDVQMLRLPPHLPETPNPFDDWARTGVPVQIFPSWVRCPACDRIGPAGPPLFELRTYPYRPEMASFRHVNCAKTRGKAPPAVPVRFVLACRGGHLDEFPWALFVHRGAPCPSPILEMFERNQSSRADDVLLTCRGCNATRSMVDAFGESAHQSLPHCRGRHPHLRTFDDEVCQEKNRTLLLGASNTWFSVALRALAIPEAATSLGQLLEDAWPQLAPIDSPAMLAYALQNVPALAALSGEDPDAIWEAMLARRGGEIDNNEEEADLLAPEWAQLSEPGSEANFPDFKIRERPAPPDCAWLVERVVAVERLREAVALIGFTRVDPPGEADAMGEEADVGPLCRGRPTWVPCTEVRGEGLFIQLREDAISAWEARISENDRLASLHEGHQRWRARRRLDPRAGWPGARYLALHSFSHLLMRELALECGYGSASIRERIYARNEPEPMAGVLLYTAAPDSEGTLGGLVSLAEPDVLGRLINQALRRGRLCASDPMCAEHVPSPDEDTLHGAACHACLFAPETSCERANRYLDRALVVETFVREELGLFMP
jgi:hypothetical protein